MRLKTALVLVLLILPSFYVFKEKQDLSGAPPFGIDESQIPEELDPYSLFVNWERPAGPAKVGIQVGHWKNDEAPEELVNLRKNSGAYYKGVSEVEVNHSIANLLAESLKSAGVSVDILPTTVPPDYWADVFIAIHADGSTDISKSGYKFAGPWRDFTGRSEKLVDMLDETYGSETNMIKDSVVTRNMKGYFAFNWWKYEHSIHPMTVAVIAETGFLTNANDRKIIVENQELSAKALSTGIIAFLKSENLL